MEVLGYIASLLIGVSLGLVGAGGSILTVPVMVYLFHIPVLTATSYSLFIVGTTSMMGTWHQFRQDAVNTKVSIMFSLVSITMVFVIRHYVLPMVPDHLFYLGGVPVTAPLVSMVLFSMLMLTAAYAMIRKKNTNDAASSNARPVARLVFCGLLVGLVTGFLGAGGGFILIPSLVLLLGLPMRTAIGTSLMIIALNSLFGFALDLGHLTIDWTLLGGVTLVAVTGIFMGMAFGKKMGGPSLRVSFGWLVMALGGLILVAELASFLSKT